MRRVSSGTKIVLLVLTAVTGVLGAVDGKWWAVACAIGVLSLALNLYFESRADRRESRT